MGAEGWNFGSVQVYAYVTVGDDYEDSYVDSASNVWVDGRYLNEWNYWEKGAKFSDYPQAAIMVRGMTYTDYYGEQKTGDVWFNYDADSDSWKAFKYLYENNEEYPEEFILTQEEVAELQVDKNTNTPPENGFIYDGTVKPGTPFSN